MMSSNLVEELVLALLLLLFVGITLADYFIGKRHSSHTGGGTSMKGITDPDQTRGGGGKEHNEFIEGKNTKPERFNGRDLVSITSSESDDSRSVFANLKMDVAGSAGSLSGDSNFAISTSFTYPGGLSVANGAAASASTSTASGNTPLTVASRNWQSDSSSLLVSESSPPNARNATVIAGDSNDCGISELDVEFESEYLNKRKSCTDHQANITKRIKVSDDCERSRQSQSLKRLSDSAVIEDNKKQRVEEAHCSNKGDLESGSSDTSQQNFMEDGNNLMLRLDSEEKEAVRRALHGSTETNYAQIGTNSVRHESMQRLRPGKWLDDEVINFYLKDCLNAKDRLKCIESPGRKRSHFFNSFFVQAMFDDKNDNHELRGKYNYKNVKRWAKNVPGRDIFSLKYIFCPINVGNLHWTLACVCMEEKKIRYLDSFGRSSGHRLHGLLQYLKDEWSAKKEGEMDVSEWELVECETNTPQQLNGCDCGVFICMFAAFMANDLEPAFTQHDIPQCRERIALSIIKHHEIEKQIAERKFDYDATLEEAKATLHRTPFKDVASQIISFLELPSHLFA